MKFVPTGSQTVGPFFAIGLNHLCTQPASVDSGTVRIQGRIIDGNGDAVPDAVLEIWQADRQGCYATEAAHPSGYAVGFRRIASEDLGCFSFTACRPGPVPFDNLREQAPHLVVLVFARGLLRHLITRMYFPDEPSNATDPILQSLPADRRETLIARSGNLSAATLTWDIVLQGVAETVFFAW
jgi:protocatechuate 3,4-dioxygenase, alpha subunit